MFEVIDEVKCINNINNNGDKVPLTINATYKEVCSNTTKENDTYMVFDDNGELCKFNKKYFEVTKTTVRNNTGWTIKCLDCKSELSLTEIVNNNNKCPKCGQIFK